MIKNLFTRVRDHQGYLSKVKQNLNPKLIIYMNQCSTGIWRKKIADMNFKQQNFEGHCYCQVSFAFPEFLFWCFTEDSLADLDGAKFSTYDNDNDDWVYNCAQQRHGAWWYRSCTFANLNGLYLLNGAADFRGVYWFYWKHSVSGLKKVEMKMRPASF